MIVDSVSGVAVHLGEADRDADVHDPVLPDEAEVADRLAQVLGDALRHVEGAVEQQHAELVAAEPGERVGRADAGLQHARDLLQQPVAGLVAAGVVDDLELVEVEVEHDVARSRDRRASLQRLVEAMLELAAIDQAGQRVVGRLVGERALQPALLADVVEDHDDADQSAGRGRGSARPSPASRFPARDG